MPPYGSLVFRLACLRLRLRAWWLVRRTGTTHPVAVHLAAGRWDVLEQLFAQEVAYTADPVTVPSTVV